jgi:sulfatase modifying factor 1
VPGGQVPIRERDSPRVILSYTHQGWRSGHRVPIYMALKELTKVTDFAEYLPIYFAQHNFPNAHRFVEKKLQAGDFVFLLDALDEVEEYEEFLRIVDLLASFTNRYCNDQYNNLIIITSRPQSYLQCIDTLSCQIVELLEFELQQIHDFVLNWFSEEPKRAEKLWQILSQDRVLLEISANPLMLTLIVETFDQRNELATSRRAELFSQIVNVRFWEWDSVRRVRRNFKFTQPAKERFLKELALQLNAEASSLIDRNELLKKVEAFIKSTNFGDPDEFDHRHGTLAKRFIWEIAEGSGILIQKAISVYDFSHKTVREYFVALRLCELSDGEAQLLKHLRDPVFDRWEMVTLFYAGKSADATGIIQSLLQVHHKLGERFLLLAGRCVLEAANIRDRRTLQEEVCDAIFDLLKTTTGEGGSEAFSLLKTLGAGQLEKYVRQLLDAAKPGYIDIAMQLMPKEVSLDLQQFVKIKLGEKRAILDESERSKAAALLAQADIGDAVTPLLEGLKAAKAQDRIRACLGLAKLNRPDAGVLRAIRELMGSDPDPLVRHACRDALLVLGCASELNMVCIPAGEFWMGTSEEQVELLTSTYGWHPASFCSEMPTRRVYLRQFFIDRVPVTNANFSAFVQATGYKTTAEKNGRGWIKTGADRNVSQVNGVDWAHPRGPDSSWEEIPDHPVVLLSSYDTIAYARWTGKKLPTEMQWEKAARGTDGRLWPWGNEWNMHLCNSAYRHIGTEASEADAATWWDRFDYAKHGTLTTPVNSFPDGASPYGVLDCVGNVCERTSDWYKPYPGTSHKSEYYGEQLHVMRGGAWHHTGILARISARDYAHPMFCTVHDGFRCVVEVGEDNLQP